MQQELKFEPIIHGKFLSQIRREEEERRLLEANKKRKLDFVKEILSAFFIVAMLIAIFLIGIKNESESGYYAANPDKTSPIHYTWVEPENESETTCDVLKSEVNPTDGHTDYYCVMPDGNVEIFYDETGKQIENATEVTFSYTDESDYSTYEIVEIR